MEISTIIFLILIYTLSAGFLALLIMFGEDRLDPKFTLVIVATMFVPGINYLMFLFVAAASVHRYLSDGKEKEKGGEKGI